MNQDQSTFQQAYDYSIRILAKRDYSTHKITQKLIARNFSEPDIEEVIEKLTQMRFLREEEYTRSKIVQLLTKGLSNDYILAKLEQEHLISDERVIEELRAEHKLDSTDQLEKLINKKLAHQSIPRETEAKIKLKEKLMRFCVSKGYSFEEVSDQLDKIL